MLAIGLTGGIGSGKTAVAEQLVERGAVLIDADRVARDVVAPGGSARQPLIERFGEQILDSDGLVDRPALAAIAFNDPQALADLNAITHPAIGIEMIERRNALADTDAVVVLAIPLLTPAHRQMVGLHAVVVVDCPVEIALERLVGQRGMDRADAEARMAVQVSRDVRREGADVVVDNASSLEHLSEEVERLWQWLQDNSARLTAPEPDGNRDNPPVRSED